MIYMLLAALYLHAQQQPAPDNGNKFKLSVLINPGLEYALEDSTMLAKGDTPIDRSWTYDRNHRCRRYTYDSLTAGNYSFYTRDLWGRVRSCIITLQHDTTIILPADHYQQVNTIPLNVLKQADNIQLFYRATGCYLHRIEKVILTKNKHGKTYTVTRTQGKAGKTDTFFHVAAGMINDLHHVISTTGDTPDNVISTTQQSFGILVGDKLFYYHDQANQWRGYNSFMGRWLTRKE